MKNQFIYSLRVHVEDTDFSGIVFHANYFKFMERARSEWLHQIGLGLAWQKQHHIYFLVHSAQIQFLKPALLHEEVEVVSSIKALGKASLIMDQYLRGAHAADKIFCKAEIKLVCVDETLRPCAIPETPVLDSIRRTLS